MRRAQKMNWMLPVTALIVVATWPPSLELAQTPATAGHVPRAVSEAADAAALGERLRRRWDLAGAEAAFRKALSLDAANLQAALGQARIARARFHYGEALALLEKTSEYHHDSPELLNEYGFLFLVVEEPGVASKYFEDASSADPKNIDAAIGLAGAELLLRRYDSAERRLLECLSGSPANSRVLVMLARVLLEKNQNKEAGARIEEALAVDPFDTDGIYLLAFVRAAERKPADVRALAERGLALDPLAPGLRRMLASYVDGQAGYSQQVSHEGHKRYERGRLLKQKGKLDDAAAEFEAALKIDPRYYRSLIGLGDIRLRQGDNERAAAAAKLALGVDPEGTAGHLELSYAYLGMQERARLEIGATDFSALYYKEATVPAFKSTAEIFTDYHSLTRNRQIVIDRLVAPLAQFLRKLVEARAKHYLLPFDERLGDSQESDRIKDQKTFDGRYYASVRGMGGRTTVSGMEYLDVAARGGVNVVAHEFAHQVHINALAPEDVKLVRKLYEDAVRDGATLDFYAAADEYEYFAQGYEAFISARKRPGASVTARHTSKELLSRDPRLYDFFLRLAEGSKSFSEHGASSN